MPVRYAVLYGDYGVKNFRKKSNAVAWGKKKVCASKYRKVYVDKITTYPKARRGEMDWSQGTVKVIRRPKKCRR